MAAFNGQRFLAEQLESIEAQTRQPDEILIVDDASTDGTVALLSEFQARNPGRVEVRVAEANRGVDASFAAAIGACSADLILPCDQDDRWHPEKIERLAGEAESQPALGLVASDSSVIGEDGEELEPSFWRRMGVSNREVRRCNDGDAFRVLVRHPFVSGHGMLFRRDLLSLALPVPAAWTYDEWLDVILSAQAPVRLLQSRLTCHRLHSRQAVGHGGESHLQRLRTLRLSREKAAIDRQLMRAEALKNRLESVGQPSELRPTVHETVVARIEFIRARRMMRDSGRPRRWLLIARELASGRYWSVGRGLLAVIRDLAS